MNVLVVYATKRGTTGEVAEAVADRRRVDGADVHVTTARAMREPVDGYDLVVIGAPLYSGRWHHHAHRFLRRHRRELAVMPVAVFGMGPREDVEEDWQGARRQLERALAKHDWLRPAAVAVFGGADKPGRSPRRDLRDWDAIRAWADQCLTLVRRAGRPQNA